MRVSPQNGIRLWYEPTFSNQIGIINTNVLVVVLDKSQGAYLVQGPAFGQLIDITGWVSAQYLERLSEPMNGCNRIDELDPQ